MPVRKKKKQHPTIRAPSNSIHNNMEAEPTFMPPPTPALPEGGAGTEIHNNTEQQQQQSNDDNNNNHSSSDTDNIHPPVLVTLSPVTDPDMQPLPDSPLSSPPDSPRSLSSGEVEQLQLSATAASEPERRRQPKEAELLLERRMSSLELPRMMSPLLGSLMKEEEEPEEEEAVVVMEATNKTITTSTTNDDDKMIVVGANAKGVTSTSEAPFDEGVEKKHKNKRDFPSYRSRQTIRGTNNGEEDSDAPDDEKKVDDVSHIPMVWREEEEEQQQEKDLFMADPGTRGASFSSSKMADNYDDDKLQNTRSNPAAAAATMQSASFQSNRTFEGDEIMSTDGEPPSLQVATVPRRTIADIQKKYSSETTPVKVVRSLSLEGGGGGGLPALASPPSPPLELDLASPESSAAASGDDPPSLSLPAAKGQNWETFDNQFVGDTVESTALLQTSLFVAESKAVDAPDATTNGSVDGVEPAVSLAELPSLTKNTWLSTKPGSITDISRSKTTGDLPAKTPLVTESKKELDSPPITGIKRPPRHNHWFATGKKTDDSSYTANTNRFVGVDREQHLKFAALKRDITSRSNTLLSPVQHRIEMKQQKTDIQASDSDDQPEDGSQESIDSNVRDTAVEGTFEAAVALPKKEMPVVVSPDGETDALELSLMVSPDGEIDYQRAVLNIVPQDDHSKSQEFAEAVAASEDESDYQSSSINKVGSRSRSVDSSDAESSILEQPPISRSASEDSTYMKEDEITKIRRSQHIIQTDSIFVKKVKETIELANKETRTRNTILAARSAEGSSPAATAIRLSSSDVGKASPTSRVLRSVISDVAGSYVSSRVVASVASTNGSYVPPNQAWSDYLTFRGVAVNMPKSTKTCESVEGIEKKESNDGAVVTTGQQPDSEADGNHVKTASIEETENAKIVETFPETKTSKDVWLEKNSGSPAAAKMKPKPAFREMTPNRDLQGSEKSSEWLEAELLRRAFVKQEINDAIEDRGRAMRAMESDEVSEGESKPLSGSISEMDEEVAAINAEEEQLELLSSIVQSPSDGRIPGNNSMDEAPPRRLFGAQEETAHEFADFGDSADSDDDEVRSADYEDMQVEMKKFAMDTRAALRDQSFTEKALAARTTAKFMPLTPPSPVAVDPASGAEDPSVGSSNKPKSAVASTTKSSSSQPDPLRSATLLKTAHPASTGTDFADLTPNAIPVLLRSMDYFEGIAKGDITLSLLSENTGSGESSVGATWANRVRGAIWRSRKMRRNMKGAFVAQGSSLPGSPSRRRSSLPVDVDGARVAGSFRTVASTQDAALLHLKHDEVNEAIELFEDIIFAYYSYFEKSLTKREENPGADNDIKAVDFQLYVGVALHNLGVLNLLRGEYDEAISYFTRAVENRRSHLGKQHPDYLSSLVKLAVCRFAVNEFAEAHTRLEEALVYARRSCITIDDRMLMAEILNNLGCLAYMCGQPVAANGFYRDSMDVQFGVLSDSLYAGNATWGQTISLNISITRANIGFIKLVTKELPVAITALENALMEQQILLKGGHETVIATMDHLAVANLLYGDQEKAALMFIRILDLQQTEYGPQDPRCFVTIDKINMVQGKGGQYKDAIEALHKTFTMPEASAPVNEVTLDDRSKSSRSTKSSSKGSKKKARKGIDSQGSRTSKPQKNKVIKVLNSIRKMKP